MLIKEEKKQEEMKEEKNPYEWPKSYYMEIDPGKRRQLLEERIREGDEGEDNLLRMELWANRKIHIFLRFLSQSFYNISGIIFLTFIV